MTPRFRTLLLEALTHFRSVGYTSEADLTDWLLRLRAALERELPTDEATRKEIAGILTTIFARDVDRGGLTQRVPGVSRYTLDRIAPHLRAELDRRIFASADLIKLNKTAAVEKTLQRFSGWVSSTPPSGSPTTNVRELAAEIQKPTKQLKFERRRVAIDQGHKLSAAIASVVAEQSGAIAAIWHDRGQYDHGYDARPEHLNRSGKLFLVRDSWAMTEGLIKKGGLSYTDEIEQPAELVYCFPGSTRIPFADGVGVGYRRFYSGELAEIVTASGKTMRATPNHPILTPKGWVACGALQEGDDVIEVAEQRVETVVAELDDDDAEPTIAQIYGALAESGIAGDVSGSRFQFHGDGSEEDVNVVVTHRSLKIDFVTARTERVREFTLTKPDARSAAARAFEFLGSGGLAASARSMRLGNSGASPLGGTAVQVDPRGLTDGANGAADCFNARGQSKSTNANFGGERLDGLAGFVTPTKIVKVERRHWSGHVYNLQTATGWYVAEGIVAHNCSCWYEYVTSPRDVPAELLTAKGRAWIDGRGWVAGLGPTARTDSAPTPAQLAAGNYRKTHVTIQGIDIAIETPKSAMRHGVGADGKPWSVAMPADYGYVKRTMGADGEQFDCYIGPDREAPTVWVIEQIDLGTGAFDEHKAMIGFASRAEALSIYSLGFSDGMGAARIGGVLEMLIAEFKAWQPVFA